jgi:hypothetical protein
VQYPYVLPDFIGRLLKLVFPQPVPATIAAAAIGCNNYFISRPIAL